MPSPALGHGMSTMKQLSCGCHTACHFLETTGKEMCTGDISLWMVSMVSSAAALQLDLQHVKLVKYSSLNERKMFHAQK